jgi:thiol-disulfide isomerase/thioredoxin
MKKQTAIIAAAVLMGGLTVFNGMAKQLWAKSYLGKKGPQLQVEEWITEKPDTTGKFVLIDFWATWCPPCRKAIPHLNEFQEKFKEKLVVIGISDESKEKVAGFESPKIKYAQAIDTQARTKKAFEVRGIPHVVVLDPQGIVRWEGFPFLQGEELTEEVMAEIINAKAD